ncbi:hypothetical protein HPB52_016738 [Rhipicephalus sanguineus]|uniref:Chitinase n=1 Tax=Rhipicephalus sanguineus TaxID=34632 RepID=A0A9D4PKX1_RHISA|nr:hypothetical protein HPB52_016738 [Rhipicephalus sanguineus]
MARSEESSIISVATEGEGYENPPMKVSKPRTWIRRRHRLVRAMNRRRISHLQPLAPQAKVVSTFHKTAIIPFQLSQKSCIEDIRDKPVCTQYPITSKTLQDQDWWPSNKHAPPQPPGPTTVIRGKLTTLARPVICVLNISTQEFWERNKASDVTWVYCAVLVLDSLSVGTPKSHSMGRRGTLALDRSTFDDVVKRTRQFVTQGQGTTPIYVTVGGERSDSPAFVSMLQDETWRTFIADSLYNFQGILDGINVYWNYPGDLCDLNGAESMKGLHWLVRNLKDKFTGVMLTVPPSRDLVHHYRLTDALLEQLSYVLVATHTLKSCDDIVQCGGARQFAMSAFLRVRLDYDVRFRYKFAYSISLAAYTSPRQMGLRMRRAFDDTMGDTAVALFDSQLDDVTGACDTKNHSPLVVALATGGEEIVGTV